MQFEKQFRCVGVFYLIIDDNFPVVFVVIADVSPVADLIIILSDYDGLSNQTLDLLLFVNLPGPLQHHVDGVGDHVVHKHRQLGHSQHYINHHRHGLTTNNGHCTERSVSPGKQQYYSYYTYWV